MIAQEVVNTPNMAGVWITLIVALGGMGTTFMTLYFQNRTVMRKQDEQGTKIDEIAVVGAETHVLANSNFEEQQKRADKAEELAVALREEIRELKTFLETANRKVGRARQETAVAKAAVRGKRKR